MLYKLTYIVLEYDMVCTSCLGILLSVQLYYHPSPLHPSQTATNSTFAHAVDYYNDNDCAFVTGRKCVK